MHPKSAQKLIEYHSQQSRKIFEGILKVHTREDYGRVKGVNVTKLQKST